MGNQASGTGKWGTELKKKKGCNGEKARKIGILAFEVASVMSKAVQLWRSLCDQDMRRLRMEVVRSEGVHHLVSDDESVLLGLACIERLQDLTAVALGVSRLGKRCLDPALQGFEHVYDDILRGSLDAGPLAFPRREMDSKIRKMERYIASTTALYQELESLTETEQALLRALHDPDPAQKENNVHILEQKLSWQRHEVSFLEDGSLWSRTYDKAIGLLAGTLCSCYVCIIEEFGSLLTTQPPFLLSPETPASSSSSSKSPEIVNRSNPGISQTSDNGSIPSSRYPNSAPSPPNRILAGALESYKSICFSPGRQFLNHSSFREVVSAKISVPEAALKACRSDGYLSTDSPSGGWTAGGLLIGNLSQSLARSFLLPYDSSGGHSSGAATASQNGKNLRLLFDPKSRLLNAPPHTLGGSALAMHYANIVLIIERMVRYPHLISPESRDDLYQMLPKSLRAALRVRLRRPCRRACSRSNSLIWDNDNDSPLDWKETLERLLAWLTPLAHNMIRWQAEHNIEQQNDMTRTNVLLLQTLFFADQQKTEAAITDLIVGLNQVWRYEVNTKANTLAESVPSSKDLDEYLEWQLQ